MMNYILSGVYIVFFLCSLYFLGNIVFAKTKQLPLKIVYVYLIYKFFTSLFGCIVQILRLPFYIYFIALLLLWIGTYIFAFYKKKKDNIVLKKKDIKEDIKRYSFIIVIACILIFFSMINIQYHWFGNHLDDGYYVNTVWDYIRGVNTFNIHPSNGLNQITTFGPYSLNTWQIEAAFYAKLFHVEPTVLLKFAQSFINYIIFAFAILAFLEKILSKEVLKKYKYQLQFIPVVTILFIFQFDVLNLLIHLQDGWQFGNAMFYGSTIIRTMGIFLLLLPIIDKEKLKFKDLVIYGCISFLLLAQSSVGLPVVVLTAIAYYISHLIFDKKNKLILIGLLVVLAIAGIVLPNIKSINDLAINLFQANYKSIILYGALIIFILGYKYKSVLINKVDTTILLMILFIYVPQLNDITENLSMYNFVEARLWTGLFYFIAILAFTYAFILACKILSPKWLLALKILITFLLVLGATLSFIFKHNNIISSLAIIKNNTRLLPNATVKLGNELEKLHKSTKKHLYVLTPDWVENNGYGHSLAVLLRQRTSNSSIISAIPRYNAFANKKFKGYSQENNDSYTTFINNPNEAKYKSVEKTLNKYPINCLVSTVDLKNNYINRQGFSLKKTICSNDLCYYIYYKEI